MLRKAVAIASLANDVGGIRMLLQNTNADDKGSSASSSSCCYGDKADADASKKPEASTGSGNTGEAASSEPQTPVTKQEPKPPAGGYSKEKFDEQLAKVRNMVEDDGGSDANREQLQKMQTDLKAATDANQHHILHANEAKLANIEREMNSTVRKKKAMEVLSKTGALENEAKSHLQDLYPTVWRDTAGVTAAFEAVYGDFATAWDIGTMADIRDAASNRVDEFVRGQAQNVQRALSPDVRKKLIDTIVAAHNGYVNVVKWRRTSRIVQFLEHEAEPKLLNQIQPIYTKLLKDINDNGTAGNHDADKIDSALDTAELECRNAQAAYKNSRFWKKVYAGAAITPSKSVLTGVELKKVIKELPAAKDNNPFSKDTGNLHLSPDKREAVGTKNHPWFITNDDIIKLMVAADDLFGVHVLASSMEELRAKATNRHFGLSSNEVARNNEASNGERRQKVLKRLYNIAKCYAGLSGATIDLQSDKADQVSGEMIKADAHTLQAAYEHIKTVRQKFEYELGHKILEDFAKDFSSSGSKSINEAQKELKAYVDMVKFKFETIIKPPFTARDGFYKEDKENMDIEDNRLRVQQG